MRRVGLALAAVLLVGACSSSSNPTKNLPPEPGVSGAASSGCNNKAVIPTVTNARDSMQVAGTTRDYLLTAPLTRVGFEGGSPFPLVLDFHGYDEGDQTEALATQFSPLAQKDHFIVAFPQGTGKPVQWDTSTSASNPDLIFVKALIQHLEATQCIDRSRIYATGLSQGAFMTSTLACTMSNQIAAFAPVSGVQLSSPCPAKRPAPILAFHGTADPILHFNGGIGLNVLNNATHARATKHVALPKVQLNGPGYPATVRKWAARDGCAKTPTNTKLSPHVIHRVYQCPKGVAVEFDIILGGGHTWPGSQFDKEIVSFVGPTTSEINATNTIWAFFQRFQLNHLPNGKSF